MAQGAFKHRLKPPGKDRDLGALRFHFGLCCLPCGSRCTTA